MATLCKFSIFLFLHGTQILFIGNTFASLPRTKRGAGIVLGPDPKGKNILYTNGNSVYIRDVNVST